LAGKFTDEQLTALADFFGSPAGKAERDRTPELNVAMQHAGEAVDKNVTTAAHAIYCATHDCDSPRLQPASAARPAASTRRP